MSLDNPRNVWDAVSTLIDMVRDHQTQIELMRAQIELLELKKSDRAGRRKKSAVQDTASGPVHAYVREQEKGNGQMPAEESGRGLRAEGPQET